MNAFSKLITFLLILLSSSPSLFGQSRGYIENAGQWDDEIIAQHQLPNGVVWFFQDRVRFALIEPSEMSASIHEVHEHPESNVIANGHCYEMHFGTSASRYAHSGRHRDYLNYFLGKDRSRWATRVGIFDTLTIQDVAEGVDVVWELANGQPKYTYIVQPGYDIEDLLVDYRAVRNVGIDDEGNLSIQLSNMTVTELSPFAYQMVDGDRKEIDCSFHVRSKQVSFEVGDFDDSKPLYIDPVVVASTNVGSGVNTFGHSATYDQFGNIYGGGRPFGTGYPVDTGSFQMDFGGGGVDIGISKLNDDGSDLLWSSYIGGSGAEYVHSIVVNGFNDVIVYGKTTSTDFPTSVTAFDTTHNGGEDICLTVLSDSGDSLIGSTYLGGNQNDGANAIFGVPYASFKGEVVCDLYSNVFVASTSSSADYPVSTNAYQTTIGGSQDGVITKLNYNLSQIEFSTFLGDSLNDGVFNVKPAKDNSVYVVGITANANFPVTENAHDTSFNFGTHDAFISRLSSNGEVLLQSTFVEADSGVNERGLFLQIDRSGDVYILGTAGNLGGTFSIQADTNRYSGPSTQQGSFIRKYGPLLDTLHWTTTFANLSHSAFLVDNCKNIYAGGNGANTTNFELTSDAVQPSPGGFYILVLNSEADSLIHGTFYGVSSSHVDGGTSRFDKRGAVYQATCTNGFNFPLDSNAWSGNQNGGNYDLTLFKIDFEVQAAVANAQVAPNNAGCVPHTVDFTNFGSLGLEHYWDFDDGDTSNVPNPTHTFSTPGVYEVKYVIYDTVGCVLSDTAVLVITVYDTSSVEILGDSGICTNFVELSNNSPFSNYTWSTGDQTQNITVSASGEVWLEVSNVCGTFSDTFDVVIIPPYDFTLPPDTGICEPGFILDGPSDAATYLWNTGDTTQSTPVDSTGDYILIASNDFCSDTDTVNIRISYVNFTTRDTVVCEDSVILGVNAKGGTIQWSTGDTTEQIVASTAGTYWATVSNGFCSTTDTINLSFSPTLVDLGPDLVVCEPTSFTVFDSSLVSYLWSTGDTIPSVVVDTSMLLWVIVSNGLCSDTDSVDIERQRLNFQTTEELVCDKDSHTIYAPGPRGSSFSWANGDSTRATQITESGTYVVTVSTEACVKSDSITVSFNSSPDFSAGGDAVICSGEGYDIQVSPVYGDVRWNTGDTGRVLSVTDTGVYIASMTQNGCEARDTVVVSGRKLNLDSFFLVPNVITPNDDGINDALGLKIADPTLVTEYMLAVYNRWGTLVFESEFINHNWDGRLPSGEPCKEGVYYYIFTANTTCTDLPVIELRDHVTVMR